MLDFRTANPLDLPMHIYVTLGTDSNALHSAYAGMYTLDTTPDPVVYKNTPASGGPMYLFYDIGTSTWYMGTKLVNTDAVMQAAFPAEAPWMKHPETSEHVVFWVYKDADGNYQLDMDTSVGKWEALSSSEIL